MSTYVALIKKNEGERIDVGIVQRKKTNINKYAMLWAGGCRESWSGAIADSQAFQIPKHSRRTKTDKKKNQKKKKKEV